ncbi:transcription initiation factor IIB family protein [Natronococcus occultus]|uniref:Transcription initiation factor TFIIIB, Brf1 subunit/transcription initiation factor TFIIB n=1 Tax=Natronococcus occultus SP4 TaxID=694430 RepID=L0JVZ9_9EURY|nr:transcription initiation factor TFIIIB, Brf1 subunit/transcription initiation factor TFIIB [Natronococcus occultus]AGB37202.1 transcription initiation factor TFIIIB, Brf1 subunit/transcription initiation factor TFIIB [Natronococcus occultus SP4]
MHSARDRVEYDAWLQELEQAADRLELSSEARSCATELFLLDVPEADRSKRATLAASLYAGSLVASDGRTQGEVASATDVSRLSIQSRWKELLEDAGLEPPRW